MIDWLTLWLDSSGLGEEQIRRLRGLSGRVMKISPEGSIEWEAVAREVIRSDSHQVTVAMGTRLMVCGSPARVNGLTNVFGSGDIRECARSMIGFVATSVGVLLPPLERWTVSRIDITHNYDLLTGANVRAALLALRHSEGGRYQLKTSAESVYWSTHSKYRSGKAYAKGPQVEKQRRQGLAEISQSDLALTARLLRLEVSLKSEWWRLCSKKQWFDYSENDLDTLHADYFRPLVGSLEVTEMSDVKEQAVRAAVSLGLSEGAGRSAYLYWCSIQSEGLERCRENTHRRTHYRYVQILRAAGLSYADFQARKVVELRRVPLVLSEPVRSWEQLRVA